MIKICQRYTPDADSAGMIYNNAMLRIFKSIERYTEEGKLNGWIKMIVVNCCIDFCKKKNIFSNAVSQTVIEEVIIQPEVFDKISGKEIQKLLGELPAATATVFKLFIYEGFTHKQIAEQLNISDGTSKWHVNEARKLLKEKFNSITTKVIYLHAS
jgi:RNA polymerase sigma-70 factor (ECF subfamily)